MDSRIQNISCSLRGLVVTLTVGIPSPCVLAVACARGDGGHCIEPCAACQPPPKHVQMRSDTVILCSPAGAFPAYQHAYADGSVATASVVAPL